MTELTVGASRYRLSAVVSAGAGTGRWVAHATRLDVEMSPFGPSSFGPTEAEAVERLSRWIVWQHAHAEALERLQQAERDYHRVVTAGAFAGSADGARAASLAPLSEIDTARLRLDEIRGRRPEVLHG